MHVRLIVVGERQPAWVNSAFDSYVARFPRQWKFRLEAIGATQRKKGLSAEVAKDAEGEKIMAKLKPAEVVIALDEHGRQSTSREIAGKLDDWQIMGTDLVFVVGGPDGLARKVLDRANIQWSLSKLTLPHGLARVLFVEQLYRAWSLLTGHPYHRE